VKDIPQSEKLNLQQNFYLYLPQTECKMFKMSSQLTKLGQGRTASKATEKCHYLLSVLTNKRTIKSE